MITVQAQRYVEANHELAKHMLQPEFVPQVRTMYSEDDNRVVALSDAEIGQTPSQAINSVSVIELLEYENGGEAVVSRHDSQVGDYTAKTTMTNEGVVTDVEASVVRNGYKHTFKDPARAAKAAKLITGLASKRIKMQDS